MGRKRIHSLTALRPIANKARSKRVEAMMKKEAETRATVERNKYRSPPPPATEARELVEGLGLSKAMDYAIREVGNQDTVEWNRHWYLTVNCLQEVKDSCGITLC